VREPDRRYGVELTELIKVGLIFAAVGAVIAAMGISVLVHAARGGLGMGIAGLATSLLVFYVAGRMFWTYRHFKKHPQLGRGLDSPPLLVDPDQPYRMRLLIIGLAVGAGGGSVAYEGGSVLASSKPYSTTIGTIAVIIAVICFSIAGRFFWKYHKRRSHLIH
jgi:hypothetical protein